MYHILVLDYTRETAKRFETEKAARQYADEKVELWPSHAISIIGFVDQLSMLNWIEDKLEEWVIY